MHFDTSPRTLAALNERLRTDPRVVRWTMLKLGERLEDVVRDPAVTMGVDESAMLDLPQLVNKDRPPHQHDPYAGIPGVNPLADMDFSRMVYNAHEGKSKRR